MKNTLQTINDLALKAPEELVARAERHYDREISNIAERISDDDDIKIVALAGPSASGKTTTAHMLCEKLKIDRSQVMSFGDAENDCSMLEYAGLSFAMENGSDACKASAKYITESNADDGVARAVEKYALV